MNSGTGRASIDQRTLQTVECHRAFACLNDEAECNTLRFTNRDVDVVKCLDKTPCTKRRSYDGMQICTCPVRRSFYGL